MLALLWWVVRMAEWTPKPPRPAPASSVGLGAWARRNLFATPGDVALTVLGSIFIIWLGINLFGLFSLPDGVDYGAHIGGFIVGLLIGYALKTKVMSDRPMIALLNKPDAQLKR